jgi:hypothetical protein
VPYPLLLRGASLALGGRAREVSPPEIDANTNLANMIERARHDHVREEEEESERRQHRKPYTSHIKKIKF